MNEQAELPPVHVANVLRVIRDGVGHVRLEIDGEPFDLATVDGFTVHPQRGKIPSVSLSIAAWRVELVDDARPENRRTVTPDSDPQP